MKTKVKVKNKKFYYIYKTTNNVNGRYYVGMHSTNHLDNNYLGSGKIITQAVKKYGKENFVKEILKFAINKDELISFEKEIVNESMLADPKCMNIKLGGGCNYVITVAWTDKRKEEQSNRIKGKNNPIFGRKRTKEEREKISKNHADVSGENNPMFGKTQSDEGKKNIAKCMSQKNRKPHLCQHCNRIILGISNFMRYHNNNCKSRSKNVLDIS